MRAFVLHLLPDALAVGQVVGRVEVVDSGERAVCQTATDLIAFLVRAGREDGAEGPGPVDGAGETAQP